MDCDDGGEDKFYVSTLEEDRIVSSFVDWLQFIDGTRKSLRTELSDGNVIQNMLRFDPDIKVSYLNLFCRTFFNKWVAYSTKLQKKPGTIKMYLGSVKHFYRFALLNSESGALPPLPLDRIPTLETLIGQWNRSLWKSIEKRTSEKALIDMAKFPTINKIKMFDTSQLVQDAQRAVKEAVSANGKFKLTRSKFTLAQDCILCHLIFNKASRLGAIGNMTIKDLSQHSRC